MDIVDRRLNPKAKSLGNRQRFLRRAKNEIRESVRDEELPTEATRRKLAANDLLRGPAGVLFRHGGRSSSGERFIPDQEVRFDVSPRNMNLGR